MPVYSARVLVSLRPSVLDPAGEATRAAAARLGVTGLSTLRIGKAVEVELEAPDAEAARAQLELLSDRLLANPVIENWTLELKDDKIVSAAITECYTRYSKNVISRLPKQLVDRQNPAKLDRISGASDSSDAYYYAVMEALKAAKL